MGRRPKGDRAWWRWVNHRGERRIQLVVVRRGRKVATLLPAGATEAKADREVRIVAADIRAGRWDRPKDWDELLEAWLRHRRHEGDRPITLRMHKTKLGAIRRTLQGSDPLALTSDDAVEHRDKRLGDGMSPATVRSELSLFRQVQGWMMELGWIPGVTWGTVRPPRGQKGKRLLLPGEVGPWIRAAERLGARRKTWERWPAAAWLLLHGLRAGDLRALDEDSFDLLRGCVWIRDRAGGPRLKTESSQGVVWLSNRATEVIRETFAQPNSGAPAFPRPRSKKRQDVNDPWFRLMVYRTCDEAEVPRVCPHSLRHGAVTLGDAAGVPLAALQAMARHANPKTTLGYLDGGLGRGREAVTPFSQALDRAWEGRPMLQAQPAKTGA